MKFLEEIIYYHQHLMKAQDKLTYLLSSIVNESSRGNYLLLSVVNESSIRNNSVFIHSVPEGKHALPLLLEGVNTVLAKVQSTIKHNSDFQKLLW